MLHWKCKNKQNCKQIWKNLREDCFYFSVEVVFQALSGAVFTRGRGWGEVSAVCQGSKGARDQS